MKAQTIRALNATESAVHTRAGGLVSIVILWVLGGAVAWVPAWALDHVWDTWPYLIWGTVGAGLLAFLLYGHKGLHDERERDAS